MLWCHFTDEQNELNHILGVKYSDIIISFLRAYHSSLRIQAVFLDNITGPRVSSAHSEEKYGGFGNPAVFFSPYSFFILKIEVKINIA